MATKKSVPSKKQPSAAKRTVAARAKAKPARTSAARKTTKPVSKPAATASRSTPKARTTKAAKPAAAAKATVKTVKKAAAPAKKPAAAKAAKAAAKPRKAAQPKTAPAAAKPASKKAPVSKAAPKAAAKTAAPKAAGPKAAAPKAAAKPVKKTAPKSTENKKTVEKLAEKSSTKSVKQPTAKADQKSLHRPAPSRAKPQPPSKISARDFVSSPANSAPRADAPKKSESAKKPEARKTKPDFKVDDFIVYPAHGVGKIVGVEKQSIAGFDIELFVVDFDQEKMKLRVPTAKAKSVGMRAVAPTDTVDNALETLKGRARVKRTMWSRRAQEYEAKINSGDLISIAEVVRDLYRSAEQPEQSYSERQLFESAIDRMAREVAVVYALSAEAAMTRLEESLAKKKAA